MFTGADLITLLPSIQTALTPSPASLAPGASALQISKQAGSATGGLVPASFPASSALHTSVGVQRRIGRDFVLSTDFVYRHFVHIEDQPIDLNHYNSVRGPVIPKCSGAQATNPQALCSNGPIYVWNDPYRATYKGLLLRAEKRLSRRFQVLGSYAYSSNTGNSRRNGFNLENFLQNTGPLDTDFPQIANIASVFQLPWSFELGLNFSYTSAPPFSAYVGGIDFNGDGTTGDLLPGTAVNAFNRILNRSHLERLVGQFNQTFGGKNDAQGRIIPALKLPASYAFGGNFNSLDMRISRSFVLRDSWRLSLIGEVFNL